MVLGLLVGAAAGALVFKLGMDAQKMSSEGKNAGEIAGAMPGKAVENVKEAADSCCSVFGCCGGSPGDVVDAEVVEDEKKPDR